jgi:hypothetical protein
MTGSVLTNHIVGWAALGLMVGYFRANQAAGVNSLTPFDGSSPSQGVRRSDIRALEPAVCGRFQRVLRNVAADSVTWEEPLLGLVHWPPDA